MEQWLVIDLEATTEEGGWPVEEMEIIEIGACVTGPQGQELGHFQRFVRPQRRPLLTRFCRELTHIGQAEIDAAATLPEVWASFEQWLTGHPHLQGWASWGDYDRRQLELQWQQFGLDSRLRRLPHLNLKALFARQRQLPRPVGLKMALQLAGLQFQGTQHRALEDARNTARLLPLTLPARDARDR